MFSPHKNSYLQLVCAVNPRVINKAVDQAMQVKRLDPHTELPAAKRLESMQPSLYAPHVDITRARLGFGRTGLRLLVRDLHSDDQLIQLQALHSVLDQLQISESAMYLIDLHVAHRLVDLMLSRNPIVMEKVCNIISHLATSYQGRRQLMTRPKVITNLMWLAMRERKEVRYAAAHALNALSYHLCCCELMMTVEGIVENLIKLIKKDHTGTVLLHLRTLTNLTDWDPVPALKANAFQVSLALFVNNDPRIVAAAMDCMAQLCCHSVGKELADANDLNFVLLGHLHSNSMAVRISAVGLMQYATLTARSKWRAKEICAELTEALVGLCRCTKSPALQLRSFQVLINLCDCPDIRKHVGARWMDAVRSAAVCPAELWVGTDEVDDDVPQNALAVCQEFRKGKDDEPDAVNLCTYIRQVLDAKERLIRAINWKPYD
ncbi:unnamed protein product, partial [Iphiclides podalirius]